MDALTSKISEDKERDFNYERRKLVEFFEILIAIDSEINRKEFNENKKN